MSPSGIALAVDLEAALSSEVTAELVVAEVGGSVVDEAEAPEGGTGCALSGAIVASSAELGEVGSALVVDLVGLFGFAALSLVGQFLEICALLPQAQHLPYFCFLSTSWLNLHCWPRRHP